MVWRKSGCRSGRIWKGIAFPHPQRPRLCRTLSARVTEASARPACTDRRDRAQTCEDIVDGDPAMEVCFG